MVKNLPAKAGDVGLIPGPGRSPGKGNGNHSSILAWKILRTEEPGEATVHGVTKESDKQTTNVTNNKKEKNKQQMETTNKAEYLPLKNIHLSSSW